jgi:hypothetical protein
MILKKICTFLCIPFFLLCIASIFLFASCNQERQNELAEKRCNEIPCAKASCFFWNSREHRCVSDDGLEEIEKHKNGEDSLFVQEYLRTMLDMQVDYAYEEYLKRKDKTMRALIKMRKGRKTTDPIYKQSSILQSEWENDSLFYKELKNKEDSLLVELGKRLFFYKVYAK